jgi:rubrerythrin
MPKSFADLTEQEILALAITAEEEDGHIYGDFAEALEAEYPSTATMFRGMMAEENEHRRWLTEVYRTRFGEHIPLIRRSDVKGFIQRKPPWLMQTLRPEVARRYAADMEMEARRYYEAAAQKATDASTRKLLDDLAEAERGHIHAAEQLEATHVPAGVAADEVEAHRRLFVLQIIQPALAGLMDGSVSTLAPIFAAAFATKLSHDALLVGLAASIGAGISMGFAEALSDDGSLTGRGSPLWRGVICGLATTLGGLGHTLPYLIGGFYTATAVAAVVVAVELAIISYVRHRYMDTPLMSAAFQVCVGGALVFLTGILIGSA